MSARQLRIQCKLDGSEILVRSVTAVQTGPIGSFGRRLHQTTRWLSRAGAYGKAGFRDVSLTILPIIGAV